MERQFLFSLFLYFSIFYYTSGRNGTERQFLFSLFVSLFQPIFAWKEAITGFFNFLKIFAIFFWKFLLHFGWERNGTTIFIFSISRPFQTYFDLKWSPNIIIWFFDFSSFFFLEFFIACRVWTERKDNFYSLFLGISQPILAWNGAIMVFFNLFNFFAIFLEFSPTRQVGTKRNNNFYFLPLSAFSNLFWFEKKS